MSKRVNNKKRNRIRRHLRSRATKHPTKLHPGYMTEHDSLLHEAAIKKRSRTKKQKRQLVFLRPSITRGTLQPTPLADAMFARQRRRASLRALGMIY
jgi:hypothetical protein